MENEENNQKTSKVKINLISIKNHLDNFRSKQTPKYLKNNAINLQKRPLLEFLKKKENHANINSYFKSLKRNKSQMNDSKNNLPFLNSNNYNSINNESNKRLSFSPKLNEHSTTNKNASINLSGSNSVKAFQKKPIKLQFFSKVQAMSANRNKKNPDKFHSLDSPKMSQFRVRKSLKNHNLYFDIKQLSFEEDNKNVNLSNDNNDKERIHMKKRIKFKPFGFSEFYKLSKNPDVSARNIYQHYILEEMKDEIPDTSKNFTKYILKKYKNPQNKLNELYGINEDNMRRIKEIKSNKMIALKSDFNVKEYQNILCGLIKKRCDNDSIVNLKKKYEQFNEDTKNYKRNIKYKGRYTKLADKLRKNAPSYLINRLKQLDEENLILKAKYFNVDLSKNQEEKNNRFFI